MALCIVVLGPTGSGKSELGLTIAESVAGEIVNFDSVQVYRGLDVGSAKVPPQDRRNIPHHLLDIIDPAEELTAGAYARAAERVITDLGQQGKPAVLVGGTGFYLRALLYGLSPAPERNEALRDRLRELAGRRPEALHRFLTRTNSAAALRIHPHDHQKLIRAIELRGYLVRTDERSGLKNSKILKIGLNPDRKQLYERLDARSAFLFQNGLLRETESLLKEGVSPQSKALGTLGYRQATQVLTGQLSSEQALSDYQVKTRQYAKRQLTWFRKEEDVHWLSGFGHESQVQTEANLLLGRFLD